MDSGYFVLNVARGSRVMEIYKAIRQGIRVVLKYYFLVLLAGALGGALYAAVVMVIDGKFYEMVTEINAAVGFAFGLIVVLVAAYLNARLPALDEIEKGDRKSIQEWLLPKSLILDQSKANSLSMKLKVQKNVSFFGAFVATCTTLIQTFASRDPILAFIGGGLLVAILLFVGAYFAAKLRALEELSRSTPQEDAAEQEKVG